MQATTFVQAVGLSYKALDAVAVNGMLEQSLGHRHSHTTYGQRVRKLIYSIITFYRILIDGITRVDQLLNSQTRTDALDFRKGL